MAEITQTIQKERACAPSGGTATLTIHTQLALYAVLSTIHAMHTFYLPTTLAVDAGWPATAVLNFPTCTQPAASPLPHIHVSHALHRLHHLNPLRQTLRCCRLQRQYLEEQERAGRLRAKPPTPKEAPPSLKEQHGLPPHLPAALADTESALAINFSRQLWGNAVPGAALRLARWRRAGDGTWSLAGLRCRTGQRVHGCNMTAAGAIRTQQSPVHELAGWHAGYIVRDGARLQSTMKDDFVWDEAEIDFMKQQRFLDKVHHRRRDEQTRYVECRARYDAMMGTGKASGAAT